MNVINPQEAPDGFYAVRKSDFPKNKGNLCQFCDWRTECQKPNTDFENNNHRCTSHVVISLKTNKELYRNDGCDVVFKKLSA